MFKVIFDGFTPWFFALLLPFRAHLLSPNLRKKFKKRGDQTILWSNRLMGILL